MSAPADMWVFISLTIRERNGWPKIVPPAETVRDICGVDPRVMKAIAKAWSWQQSAESGQAASILDIAAAPHALKIRTEGIQESMDYSDTTDLITSQATWANFRLSNHFAEGTMIPLVSIGMPE
jgi:hypothetical protein